MFTTISFCFSSVSLAVGGVANSRALRLSNSLSLGVSARDGLSRDGLCHGESEGVSSVVGPSVSHVVLMSVVGGVVVRCVELADVGDTRLDV